jgi:CDP-2,3-bis-(O-geranylgeranyl)-sn-glycerol synthase
VDAVWVFLPVLGALIPHAPVLRLDLFPSLARPLDMGAWGGGRRVFGDNKTWRGALVMFTGTLVAAVLLTRWPPFRDRLPDDVRHASPVAYGALLGAGVVLGELPNSFLKRRLGIEPGRRRQSALGLALILYDQGDFVVGSWLTLLPIWTMPPLGALLAFCAVASVHFAINVIGYAIGARTSPI